MIDNKYPLIKPELTIHFFGDVSVITDKAGMQYKFDKTQSEVLYLCNGDNTVSDIINKLIKIYFCPNELVENVATVVCDFVESFVKKNILFLSNNKTYCSNRFGERFKFYPVQLSVELTNKCNFFCEHCYKNAYTKGEDIQPETMYKIYDIFNHKTEQIQFTGGEPFVNKNIEEYINLFSKAFKIRIATNGSLLHQVDSNIIKLLNFVQFSLYGCSSSEYFDFTKNEYGWDNLFQSVRKVSDANVDYIISVVLNQKNIHSLEDYVKAAIELNATKIKFSIPSLVGRALSDYEENKKFILTQEEMKYAYRETRRLKEKYNNKISVVVWSHRAGKTSIPFFTEEKFKGLLPCGAGFSSYVISQNGQIRPCEFFPEDLFNYGGIECAHKIINGDFYKEKLLNGVETFNGLLCECGAQLNNICTPLQLVYDNLIDIKQ